MKRNERKIEPTTGKDQNFCEQYYGNKFIVVAKTSDVCRAAKLPASKGHRESNGGHPSHPKNVSCVLKTFDTPVSN